MWLNAQAGSLSEYTLFFTDIEFPRAQTFPLNCIKNTQCLKSTKSATIEYKQNRCRNNFR